MALSVFRTKSIERSIQETDEPGHRLKRELSALDLTVFGVGVIVGTGIFVLTGQQAARNAGPAIVISFLLAAVVCALAALCYAEFASTVPVAGSAYTSATPPSASWSPGSSAGTWCWNSASVRRWWRAAGARTCRRSSVCPPGWPATTRSRTGVRSSSWPC